MQALNRITIGVLSATLLSGCQPAKPAPETSIESPSPEVSQPTVTRYDCDTLAVTATYHEQRVVLELGDRSVTLPRAPAASGERYGADAVTFWNKGREATLTINGRTETCRERREPWEEASDRGVQFRAVGQEPGWFLEIDRQRGLRLVYDYAEHEVAFPSVDPVVRGRLTTFETVQGPHRLRVIIEEHACHDSMSGEEYPSTVVVTLGQRTLKGCGRRLTEK